MVTLPNITIEEFHAGENGLIIFYSTSKEDEIKELELSKVDAARLMRRTGWLDDYDVYGNVVMVRFETIYDDINHHGEHTQRVSKLYMEWDDYRSWIVERECRDIVKEYLKEKRQNGSD
jgi:hypothetical protein